MHNVKLYSHGNDSWKLHLGFRDSDFVFFDFSLLAFIL